ncbi:C-type lectin domain family 2 member E-like [Microtus pennsylvanicus]|uniref:C-type lectin domain family 2 member E-like n=1 Tax=Microtus pennsylvanicus TaxID=10058 RepID=UPI003F6BF476
MAQRHKQLHYATGAMCKDQRHERLCHVGPGTKRYVLRGDVFRTVKEWLMSHTDSWVVLAECLLGNSEYKALSPSPGFQVSSLLLSSGKFLPLSSEMPAEEVEETSMGMVKAEMSAPDHIPEGDMGKRHQGKCLRIISTEPPVKLYCCYVVIMVLTVAVIALSVALSGFRRPLEEQCLPSTHLKDEKDEVRKEKQVVLTPGSCYANCPNGWIGFGNKCFYFSDEQRNWTVSQAYCRAQAAELARFDSLEELNFLKRCASYPPHWIGLYRESLQHPWKWTDNTEYNNLEPVLGGGPIGTLYYYIIANDFGYSRRYWICNKFNNRTLHYSMSIVL